ncbi:MAG: aldolase [Betaproteobacteria bacterium]|nr:aldolase [Betaproteobacteria bacterium]
MGKVEPPAAFDGIVFEPIASDVPDDVREALTLCGWILAANDHESGLAGQISARGEAPETYWTLPLGLGLEEAAPAAMVLVDRDLKTLKGDGRANPATRFHLWVYRARPDVNAIVHTHPPYASALAAAALPLVVAHMDSAMLFEDCAFLPEWPGVPLADREGEIISGALGTRHAIMLAHHGMLTAGRSVAEAAVLAVKVERTARTQVRAAALGGVKPLAGEDVRKAREFLRSPSIIAATFSYWARQARARRAHGL